MKSPKKRPKPRRQRLRRLLSLALIGAAVASTPGCTSSGGLRNPFGSSNLIDDFMIGQRNRIMAVRAWRRECKCYKGHRNQKHYKAGFIAGYMDVAGGGYGCVPVVAPSEYWGWRYQSPAGASAVNAWFEGFPIGAKAAEQDGVGSWSQIRTPNFTTQTTAGGVPPHGGLPHGGIHPGGQAPMIPVGEGESIIPGSIIQTPVDPPAPIVPRSLTPDVGASDGSASESDVSIRFDDGRGQEMGDLPEDDYTAVIDDIFGKADSDSPALPPDVDSDVPSGVSDGGTIPFTFN